MPLTESQKIAKKKYEQKTYRLLLVFYPKEKDLVTHIKAKQIPISTYIKDLIKKDMDDERKAQSEKS